MARSEALDLPIEAMPGNRLLAMRCPDPTQTSRLCFDYVELGYRRPDSGVGDERIVAMGLHRACRAPSLGISLALRRCAFPICAASSLGLGIDGVAKWEPASMSSSPCWIGGLWHPGPRQPAGVILQETSDTNADSRESIAPLMLSNDDLTWWLDPHLVDRTRLLRRLSERRHLQA